MSRTDFERSLVEALSDLQLQSVALQNEMMLLTTYLDKISARSSGIEPIAHIVDRNNYLFELDKNKSAQKEIITYLYKEAHTYLVVVIAAGYAAFFTTISILSQKMASQHLYLAGLLITISLTVFVFWEVISMAYLSWLMITNQLGQKEEMPALTRIGWPIALLLSVGTALPAAGLIGWSYLEGLRSTHLYEEPSTLAKPPTIKASPASSPPPPSPDAAGGP